MDKEENIRIIEDIIDNGFYYFEGEKKRLKLNKRKMKKCLVFLPEKVEKKRKKRKKLTEEKKEYNYQTENMDPFSIAQKEAEEGKEKILVLSAADTLVPGGNAREGTNEQDLCRRSTLIKSLGSRRAKKYYEYSKGLRSFLYSDAVIISPNVEVFKDSKGDPLTESFIVAVISCTPPGLKKQPLSRPGYENIMTNRIDGILTIAEDMGYKNLILGAWGCGVFGGGPETVSRIFRKELDTFSSFVSVTFAIPDKDGTDHSEFAKRFPEAGS